MEIYNKTVNNILIKARTGKSFSTIEFDWIAFHRKYERVNSRKKSIVKIFNI
jgi:hypothetical protein